MSPVVGTKRAIMVSRQDLRDVNEAANRFQNALDEMQELHEQSQKSGVTVDPSAYASAQADVKAAIYDLWVASDDAVGKTDTYTPPGDGESDVTLPDAALARGAGGNGPPEDPGN